MIPLKDDNPTSRAAVFTVLMIGANVLVFLWQLTHPMGFEWAVLAYGAIPAEVLTLRNIGPQGLVPPPLTVLTSMFMHGSIPHLVFNMLFLWIFGNNIEDALGRVRFLIFYLLCGTAAALAQIVVGGPASTIPMVGASGAIAGVLGAYLVLYPHARVLTMVPVFLFIQFVWLPAGVFLIVWFVVQLFSSFSGGPVAWYAHIGGFVAGLLLVKLLLPRRRRYRRVERVRWIDGR